MHLIAASYTWKQVEDHIIIHFLTITTVYISYWKI